jgi:hypothetical protein
MKHAMALLVLLPVLAGPAAAQEIRPVELTMKWTGSCPARPRYRRGVGLRSSMMSCARIVAALRTSGCAGTT